MAQENNNIKRIALIGPESSAKTTLAEALAKHYNTVWLPEYARTYLSKMDRKYNLDDIVSIAKHQLEEEQKLIPKANKFIFVDTELILAKVWCVDVFKTCPEWISENLLKNKYDLYLLTSPDLPWKEDALRENPHRRELLFDWYLQEIKNIGGNYFIVKGKGDERFKNCVGEIENKF